MNHSLRRQLTRALLTTLSVLLGAALVVIYAVVWRALVGAFDVALSARAGAVSALIEQRDGRVEFDFSEDFLRGYGTQKPRNYFELWDAAHGPLMRSPSLGQSDLPRPAGEGTGRPAHWNVTLPNGRAGRAIGFTFVPETPGEKLPVKNTPPVLLVVAVDRDDLDDTLGGLLIGIAICGGLLFAAVGWVVPRVLRRGLAPLDRLGSEVARLDADSLAAPLSVAELPSELRPVGDRLNELLARLASSFERERRFSADLAHELRTPLAELRSLAECALKWPEARDPATDREVLAIAAQMETLVSSMLALARGERGQLAATFSTVDLAAAVQEAWRPFAARAAQRGLRVEFSLPGAVVSADPVLLRAILRNLFDNAVAYAPAGAPLRVTGELAADGRRSYVLRCANPAGDLGPADVGRLFERFWRKESARGGGGEHVGLGLSLAHMFAVAMGWRLTAALGADGWLVFSLETCGQ